MEMGSASNKRRSQRIFVQVPVLVEEQGAGEDRLKEETQTLVINVHGALLLLSHKVSQGQELVLTHRRTAESQRCRVVFLGPPEGGKAQVGIEFLTTQAGFWHVSFPPSDWTPRHPDAKTHSLS
jgi:hypothetical protein